VFMTISKSHIGLALGVSFLLTACGGSDIATHDCPPVYVVATTERVPLSQGAAILRSGVAACKSDAESGSFLAEIEIDGTSDLEGVSVPVFMASLTQDGKIINRQQVDVTLGDTQFSESLPAFEYENTNMTAKNNRLVVGFVLSDAQLEQNRTAWRLAMGLK